MPVPRRGRMTRATPHEVSRAPGAYHPCAMRVCRESILCERSHQTLGGLTAAPLRAGGRVARLCLLQPRCACGRIRLPQYVCFFTSLFARHAMRETRLPADTADCSRGSSLCALGSWQVSLCRQLQKGVKQPATAAQQRWLRQGLRARRKRRWRSGEKWKEQRGSGGGRWQLGWW
jgi:hypothetical protein